MKIQQIRLGLPTFDMRREQIDHGRQTIESGLTGSGQGSDNRDPVKKFYRTDNNKFCKSGD